MYLQFSWVPDHSDILGNELVNSLGKSTKNVELCNFRDPFTDLHLAISDMMFKRRSMSLQGSRNAKGLTEIKPIPSSKAWFEKNSIYLGRQYITGLCRLRIGHCKFSAHLNKLKLKSNPSCSYCNNSFSDLDHLFFICTKFHLQLLLFIAQCKDI